MIPGRGKSKGNRFENLVGRLLSAWLTGGDKTQLIPTRLSGGWKDAAWRQAGDLAPNGPLGEIFRRLFVVECKHQNKDLLWRLYTAVGPGQNIQSWWAKLEEEAEKVGCFPMLVFRQNARPIMVALQTELAWYISSALEATVLFADSYGLILLDTLLALPREEFYPLVNQTPDGLPLITTTPGDPKLCSSSHARSK